MRVAIVGAGSIGVGWAVVFARAGYDVILHDPDPERLAAAPGEVRSRLDELGAFGLLPAPPGALAASVQASADLETALASSSYVQECAPEDAELKRELFARLDAGASPEAVLASSSSAMPCSTFAGDLPGRGRCLVAHPGNPPYLLPVVELVPAPFTEPDAVRRAADVLRGADMSVVRVRKEVAGFVFNRLQGALLREAYRLVRDGVADPDDVDRVVRDGLGRRWAVIGPFETADLNTRGGIEAHAERLGPAYACMGAEHGETDAWEPELVARVTAARRALLPLDRWEEGVARRDRRLMALERARREFEEWARVR